MKRSLSLALFTLAACTFVAGQAQATRPSAPVSKSAKKPAISGAAAQAASSSASSGTLKLPPYKKVKLPNGMTLLLMEQHEVPLVSFDVIVRAGSTADPAGKEGLASLAAGLLRKGTPARTAEQISADLDFIGGEWQTDVNHDFSRARAEFMAKDLDRGLALVTEMLLHPSFPTSELEKMEKQRIDGIKAAKDRAQGVIGTYFNAYLYEGHPYGRPPDGAETTIAAITREDVQNFYSSYYVPANTILAVAGDFSAAKMESTLSSAFGGWKARGVAPPAVADPAPFTGRKLLLVDKPDSTQTYYQIGNLGIARTNPDRPYIEVVNTLFGGRFTSMLNSALRIDSGLTYGAGSSFSQRKLRGPFVISTYTRNETTEKAIDATLEVLQRLHQKGISDEELLSAKNYLKGLFPPRALETTDQLAALMAQLEFYGLDDREVTDYYSRIDSVTLPIAQKTIQQYFPADNLVFVLIGKSAEIEKLAHKYATRFDTRSISKPGF